MRRHDEPAARPALRADAGVIWDTARVTAWHKPTADLLASPPWQDRADLPCQQPYVRADWWFSDARTPEAESAVLRCGGCPIRAACLEWALATDQRFGVWGGVHLSPARLASWVAVDDACTTALLHLDAPNKALASLT